MNITFLRLLKCNYDLRLLRNSRLKNYIQFSTNKFSINMTTSETNTVFQGIEDRFRGITVDTSKDNCTIGSLETKLEESLKQWKSAEKRGIWFKVALAQADWVPVLAKNGFNFHHANNGYVMMYKWLPTTSCGIPSYAHTMLAVGALVLNDKSEILVVQENNHLTGHWKFPGGVVEPDENLVDAAIREVKEETNIDVEFRSVVSFTHADKGMFGCSDLYVVMALHALSQDILKCDKEIAKCSWFNVHDYLERDDVTDFNKNMVKKYLEYQKNGIKFDYEQGVHKLSKRAYTHYRVDFKDS